MKLFFYSLIVASLSLGTPILHAEEAEVEESLVSATTSPGTGTRERAETRGRYDARQYDQSPHFYVGGSYGLFRSRGGNFDDDSDFLEGTVGGYFNAYFGVEANAIYFSRYRSDLASADSYGFGLAVQGRLPLSEVWGIYAKAGQFFWRSSIDTDAGSISADGNDFFFGVGTDVNLTESLDLIVEYARYDIDNRLEELPGDHTTDIDTLKFGLRFRF
ncbi:porin family protein [Marinimicrobium sp. ABcell2]|uniref:porin family protein n=1 Tax=Marinimicrobium sp. ABcell2 TaxID=3069751 RepID=UPI0027AFCDD4|nr:porin family protein [Marinimicrobium sp. ABcell2]MDQ2075942.1 porin family protein [Marinimicrobium sp. ABcell2]